MSAILKTNVRGNIFRPIEKKSFSQKYSFNRLALANINIHILFPLCFYITTHSKSQYLTTKAAHYLFVFSGNRMAHKYIGSKELHEQKDNQRYYHRRYHWLHVVLKNWLFKPGKKIMMKFFGRHCVKDIDDIPAEPYNTLLRINFWAKEMGRDYVFMYMAYNLGRGNSPCTTREDYLKWCKDGNFWSYNNRLDVDRMLMTMILEDTIDREIMVRQMLFIYHAMNEAFDGNVPLPWMYPMYKSMGPVDFDYMKAMAKFKTWYPPKSMFDLNLEINREENKK